MNIFIILFGVLALRNNTRILGDWWKIFRGKRRSTLSYDILTTFAFNVNLKLIHYFIIELDTFILSFV